ncbi:MAG: response regulator [Alphaproteobacteria bacterium]|nr:response regulator [Alphaproteobacteria bacterium]
MNAASPHYGNYRFDKIFPLIIDDSAHIRKLLKDVHFCFGCTRVIEASDGSEALATLKQSRVDVIFSNWVMSPMDGIEFLKQMRNPDNSPDPYVPIIMISAHSTLDHIKKSRDAGANAFLTKPFTPASLAKILATIIEAPRPFIKTKTYFGPDRRVKDFPQQSEDRRVAAA